jgi:hypothetical protein
VSAGDGRTVRLEIPVDSEEDLDALEGALLRARAAELGEWRRRETRLVAGYGDATTRESMTDEGARAKARWSMLERVLAALRAARGGPAAGG